MVEVKASHTRHLQVCNQAGHAGTAPGFQEILGAFDAVRRSEDHQSGRNDQVRAFTKAISR
jgi:hypothetical protein